MATQHICPRCGSTVIRETVITDYAFACWFCDENFYSFEVIAVERELSGNTILRELRKHLGQFIKKCDITAQIQILQKAFHEYESFCQRQDLKIYSSKGLTRFIRSVQNWKNFFERIAGNRQRAALAN